MTTRAVVLSDIHLGVAGPLSVFEDDKALAAFIGRLAQEPIATELILAGDVFDFLQCPNYQEFDPGAACDRFLSICANHLDVMDALRHFAAVGHNELTLLSGNHDPEVLLPSVRAAFERVVARVGGVRYDEALLTNAQGRSLWGRTLCGQSIWVVHGDRADAQNDIRREEILGRGTTSLPPGSRLVVDILAKIQPAKPWVYDLKPEFETVFPLLLYLDKDATLAHLKQHYGLSLTMLRNMVLAKLLPDSILGLADPTAERRAEPSEVGELLASSLVAGLGSLPDRQAELLVARLADWSRPAADVEADPPTLAPHDGVGRWLLRAWLANVRQTERFLSESDIDDQYRKLRGLLPSHVQVVIAGHTHGPRAITNRLPAYFNSGTWIPVGKLPEGNLESVIDALEAGQPWPRTVPRTYVEVDLGQRTVKLGRCDGTGNPRTS